ncbi:terminase small subunit [Enterobacter cloacae complex sp. ESBL7]|uniref:terminase small subunit n=1 Tax=Enterobacter cloacae complex sp. ESBL7 TaxID=3163325 RepID=UPI003569956F
MSRVNWDEVLALFAEAWRRTEISPQKWCEDNGYSWTSAKRHISIKKAKALLDNVGANASAAAANSQQQIANKTANSQVAEAAQELMDDGGVTDQQANFVVEYLEDFNATQAAIRAGYSKDTAGQIGYQLLQKTSIRTAIANQQKAAIARQLFTADDVLTRMWTIATVDVNELVEYRRTCCRYCWGKHHDYQWTEGEFNKARAEAETKGKKPPEIAGGFGFRPKRSANPECPQCEGDGYGHVHIHASKKLSAGAQMAYQGVKTTRDGVEVLISNRDKMLENIAKNLGLFDGPEARRLLTLEAERRQLEIDKLRKELAADPEDDEPTPVVVNINVVDARVRSEDDDIADA